MLDYDFHPPADVRVFAVEPAGVLRCDERAFVTEARYDDVVLRHYAFADHWFKINCTLDRSGAFVETGASDAGDPFSFNCDIATPMLRDAGAVFAVDLWIDVLVRQDGVTYQVGDEDEFAGAAEHSWLSEREARGAQAGLAELVDLIRHQELVAFLASVCPFQPSSAPAAIPVRHVPVDDVPLVHPTLRPSW